MVIEFLHTQAYTLDCFSAHRGFEIEAKAMADDA